MNCAAREPEKRCAGCDATFVCGAEAGACWCQDLPAVPLAPDATANCFCPECLAKKIHEFAPALAPAGDSVPELIADEDYYSEGGAVVFTAQYHLRRGYCCDSGCRHCPFDAGINDNRTTTPRAGSKS